MNLKNPPQQGVPFIHKVAKEEWTVVWVLNSGDLIALENDDGEDWEVDLDYLNTHFEAVLTPLVYHEVMDRAAMMADMFERWCCDPVMVQTHPQLRAEAEATLARLQNFQSSAATIAMKAADED